MRLGRTIGEAGKFRFAWKLVHVAQELQCFAKQFARWSWKNLPHCLQGQSDWSADSKDSFSHFYLPMSEAFPEIHLITAGIIKEIDESDMSQNLPSIKIMTDCSFAKPTLDIFRFLTRHRSSGKIKLILIWKLNITCIVYLGCGNCCSRTYENHTCSHVENYWNKHEKNIEFRNSKGWYLHSTRVSERHKAVQHKVICLRGVCDVVRRQNMNSFLAKCQINDRHL